jgi:quercetin dioxygenase-like cupin family protein
MAERREDRLERFLTLTTQAIAARVEANSPAELAMRRVRAAIAAPAPRRSQPAPPPLSPPAYQHLDPAMVSFERAGGELAQLATALRALNPDLVWRPRPSDDPVFTRGHANASVLGAEDTSLEPRDDVRIGLSLVAPHITYPDHHHPPEEVYIVLSPGEWRQKANPWHAPGVGGIVYNPHGILHAMRAGDAPLLAIWCLPV